MARTDSFAAQEACYDDIERAVCETARGRWFLAEYARRIRAAETAEVLAAIERLERRLPAPGQRAASPRPAPPQPSTPTPIEALMRRLGEAIEQTAAASPPVAEPAPAEPRLRLSQ